MPRVKSMKDKREGHLAYEPNKKTYSAHDVS